MFNQLTPAVKRLLILNAAVLAISVYVFPNMQRYLGLHYVGSRHFLPTQFLTYMFMHADLWHLFGNMIGLLVFGNLLERFWGSQRFLFFYVVTGVGAGLLYWGTQFYQLNRMEDRMEAYITAPTPQDFNIFLLDYAPEYRMVLMQRQFMDYYEEYPTDANYIAASIQYLEQIYTERANVPMVGASGAIFGILMAFGLLFPNTELFLLFPPMPIKAKYLVIFYGVYELWSEINGGAGDNIAHLAHLGGLVVGFMLVKYWQRNANRFY